MSGAAWLYFFAVVVNAVNLFLQVFFTIMYSDLEWYVLLYVDSQPLSPMTNMLLRQRLHQSD